MSYLITTPLPAELSILSKTLKKSWSHTTDKCEDLPFIHFPEKNIFLTLGGHGKVDMALKTQFWCQKLSIKSGVMCVGSAGSLSTSSQPGDVIIAETTIEHDVKNLFLKKELPSFAIHSRWKDLISQHPLPPRFSWGSLASGDEDVLAPERRSELQLKTGAMAVAWEGAGAARACLFLKIPFCEVRGITDASGTSIQHDFTKNLNHVMLEISQWILKIF